MPKCEIEGVKIYYELSGKDGIPLVFISGTGYNSSVWKPFQVPFFSKRQRVLISDHRGLGQSDKPEEPYSTRLFAKDIVGILNHLGVEEAHMLGHSMGGRVAQWIALDNPKRVRSLILASSGSGNFTKKPDYVRGIPLDVALEIGEKGFKRYFENHAKSDFFFTPEFKRRNPAGYRKAVKAHLSRPPPLHAYLRHVIARQMHETTDRLHEIRAPTLVLVGEMDTKAMGTGSHYDAARFLAENIPGAQFATVPRAKHAIFWESPDESNRTVLDFISKHG
jgi:pimeloyl-ACP methyl ester carboxylesterase